MSSAAYSLNLLALSAAASMRMDVGDAPAVSARCSDGKQIDSKTGTGGCWPAFSESDARVRVSDRRDMICDAGTDEAGKARADDASFIMSAAENDEEDEEAVRSNIVRMDCCDKGDCCAASARSNAGDSVHAEGIGNDDDDDGDGDGGVTLESDT